MPPKQLFGGIRAKVKQEASIVPEGMKGGVFYIRVSTEKQATIRNKDETEKEKRNRKDKERGNGLSDQRESILRFAEQNNVFQIGDFMEEVGSGGSSIEKRPVLQKAIELAKKHNAYLVTTKIDRLSRKMSMVSAMLDDQKFKFVTVEHGFQADDFIMHIMAAVAQKERELISVRTKAALKQVKKRYDEKYEKEIEEYQEKKSQGFEVKTPKRKRLGIPSVKDANDHISQIRKKEGYERSLRYIKEYIEPTIEELKKERGSDRTPSREVISERMIEKGYKTDYGQDFSKSVLYHTYKKVKNYRQ